MAVPLSEEEEYHLSFEVLERYATARTKMLIVNNPNNPTGRVYTRQELEDVARFARERDLLVVCDETYEYFVYDSNEHTSLAALPGMWERTISSFTFTKSYSMSGWRLGCMVAPASLLGPLVRVQEHTASFVSPFVQMGGLAALTGPRTISRRGATNVRSSAGGCRTGSTAFLGYTARSPREPRSSFPGSLGPSRPRSWWSV